MQRRSLLNSRVLPRGHVIRPAMDATVAAEPEFTPPTAKKPMLLCFNETSRSEADGAKKLSKNLHHEPYVIRLPQVGAY